MEKKLYVLKINPAFHSILPPLKASEETMLEKDIIERGCIDPLIIWNGAIVDGHTRYRICRENAIPFTYIEMAFNNETEAKLWIVKTHMARRSLTAFQRVELVLPLEASFKAEALKRKSSGIRLYKNESERIPNTRDILADMAGVSHSNVDKVKAILQIADKETLRRVRCGEISIHGAYMSLTMKNKISGSSKSAVSLSIRKRNEILPQIETAVKDLLSNVMNGDASRNMIVSQLTKVSEMLKAAITESGM